MSDFIKGQVLGGIGILVGFHYLSKILFWWAAMSAKQSNETRDQFIDRRLTRYRKSLERNLPHWEEV